jgi:Domain of unknown function (DUF4349)
MCLRLVLLTLALLCVLTMLGACGATGAPEAVLPRMAAAPTMAVAAAPTQVPTPSDDTGSTAAAPAPGSAGLASPARAAAERMIIKNAEMELLVADTDVALDEVTVIAADYGGYIISSHTWLEDEYKHATVRLGVPAQEFENVLRRLRGLALEVTNEVASGEDVTDEYVDLQSRLTNLQATRDRIREFLDKAATVEEALKVNQQLSEVEGQIEEIQGRMNYLKDRAAYSTIDVTLNPQMPTPTPSPTPTSTPTPTPVAWRPGKTFDGAVGTLTSLLRGLGDAIIWVAVVLGPCLVPVALVVALVIWLRRRQKISKAPPQTPEATEKAL